MRTRKSSKAQEGDSGLDNLLESLHGENASKLTGDGTAAPETLADASRQTVDQLLERVGERHKRRLANRAQGPKASKRGKKQELVKGEDALLHQRRLFGESLSQRDTNSDVVCGMRARTTLELEHIRQSAEPSSSLPASTSLPQQFPKQPAILQEQEDDESYFVDEDELDWEDGDDSFRQRSAIESNPVEGWTGEVTFEAEESPEEGPNKRVQKSTLRRANANDKLFAAHVHMAHLLCLLARGRMVSNASDDLLLQASLVSVLPPRLLPSASLDRVTTAQLEHLVSWFQSHFQLLLPDEGLSRTPKPDGEALEIRLPEVLQKQTGSTEELAALSVALFRGLGYTTRYVTVLDVASLKPDAESLEASVDWDYDAPFHLSTIGPRFHSDLQKQVTELSKILSRRLPPSNVIMPDATQMMTPVQEGTGGGIADSPGRGRGRGQGQGRGRKGESPTNMSPVNVRVKAQSNQNPIAINGESSLPASDAATPCKTYKRRHTRIEADPAVGETFMAQGVSKLEAGLEDGDASSEQVRRMKSKRKGDEEFDAQLAMALAATAAAAKVQEGTNEEDKMKENKGVKGVSWENRQNNGGKSKLFGKEGRGVASGAVWSRKMGPVLHWAEVYCGGEGSTGRWVHVDATRGIVDGADQVESSAAACRLPVRYVIAFAGAGAKDVTRRYVNLWSAVAPLRLDPEWWDSTLLPLKQLEAAATSGPSVIAPPSQALVGTFNSEATDHKEKDSRQQGMNDASATMVQALSRNESTVTSDAKVEWTPRSTGDLPLFTQRSQREDMEMDTKLYTEPLPTNQQAYKNHHLYVLEKWLTKYETLHPKGPVLGYCAGQPVFRRACVQTLHTSERWLREGCKVKPGEAPAKVVKSRAVSKGSTAEVEDWNRDEGRKEATMTELFGKWQTDEWQPPPAVGGIVPRDHLDTTVLSYTYSIEEIEIKIFRAIIFTPSERKNERGQVDVWSEKCLPPGTVHLRFPRLVPVCQRLGIDFAPAMVGFEIRRGRSVPVFEGLVVCEEFKDAIMEAYDEEEDRRSAQLFKKREEQAAGRWRQLLLSVATRKRLRDTYQGAPSDDTSLIPQQNLVDCETYTMVQTSVGSGEANTHQGPLEVNVKEPDKEAADPQHVHHYAEENQSYDDSSGIRTKWCACGFWIQVEEM